MAGLEYFTAPDIPRKVLARFFKRVEVDGRGCWNWTGTLNRFGYGATTYKSTFIAPHRLMYAWAVGPIPKGRMFHLDHFYCQNRKCCNPWHLELVTCGENVLRGHGISAQNARKTMCLHGHPLRIRNDGAGRYCPTCSNAASLSSYYGGRRGTGTRRQQHTGS